MYNYYGQGFIDMIKSFYPTAKVVAGMKEIVVRCKDCGDSNDLSHAHMYIKIPQSPTDIPVYHCKKCQSSGVVTQEFLRQYGCNDPTIIVELSKQLHEILKDPTYVYYKTKKIYNIHNSYSNKSNNVIKLSYINNRIGSNFTVDDLMKLKIFLNISDIVISNNLQSTRDPYIMQLLDQYFVGFITCNNSRAILRRVFDKVPKEIDYRYINYNFINNIVDGLGMYVIPTNININNTINIHIAEGVFDILSIYYNLNCCNLENNIYIASGGKGYFQALKYILETSGLIFYNIHIYPDKDVTDRELNSILLKHIYTLPCTKIIHRNIYPNQKDYGVPINYINDSVVVINEA